MTDWASTSAASGSGRMTANDSGDVDVGPNRLQNVFTLHPITTPGQVLATFSGAASSSMRWDLYASADCDRSGFGEGAKSLPLDNV